MAGATFDAMTRRWINPASRRGVMKALIGGILAVAVSGRAPGQVAAAGCLRRGSHCKHDSQCCSGACQGHRCRRAPGQGTCSIRQNVCRSGDLGCNGDESCACYVTTSGTSFCGDSALTCGCVTTADCLAGGFPTGTACVRGCCPFTGGGACARPCLTLFP